MKKISFAGKNRDELVRALSEARNNLRDYRFAATGAKPKSVKEGRTARKNIARILTELNKQK